MTGKHVFDVAIVGTVGLPARYGGFETLAEQLVAGLASRFRILVYCSGRGRDDRPKSYLGATLEFIELNANGWQSIPYDMVCLWRAASQSRALLVLGVSGCLLLPILRLRFPAIYIVTNIDGVEWHREKWGLLARMVLRASEWAAVRYSDLVVADNKGIVDHVQATYGRESMLIAYGGDHASVSVEARKPRDTRFNDGEYALAVCRIEPENHLREVLEAASTEGGCPVVVVGHWAASAFGLQLRRRYRDFSQIEMLDPIYDVERLVRLRCGAKVYVHGHSAGGTNPSLVEAMSLGMPVLAYDVAYNRYTTHGLAHYWRTSRELAQFLRELDASELAMCGLAMKRVASDEYTWQKVIAQYEAALFFNGVQK